MIRLIVVANTFAARENSVFVVIGTERELSQKGRQREGGTLLMFGRGKTIVPGRTLDPSHFTVLSKSRDKQIMLPRADKEYRIVSRQALEFTDRPNRVTLFVKGTLTIPTVSVLGAVEVSDSRGEIVGELTSERVEE